MCSPVPDIRKTFNPDRRQSENLYSVFERDMEKRGRGRPKGKKSDADYTTLTVYVRKDTLKSVKMQCLDREIEVSEIVQQLLEDWLNSDIR